MNARDNATAPVMMPDGSSAYHVVGNTLACSDGLGNPDVDQLNRLSSEDIMSEKGLRNQGKG